MAKSCGKCAEAITGLDLVICRGYCRSAFHMNCTTVTRALQSYFTSHKKNLFWMCDKCAELFENSHFRAISVPQNDDWPLSSLTTAITELRTEIQQMAAKTTSSLTPVARSRWPVVGQRMQFKRKREEQNESRVTEACKTGAKQSVGNVVAVPTYVEQQDTKFWLYISRIRPDVSSDAVMAMVKANLEIEADPTVVKLVPKGKDISSLTFVSFKIGIDADLKSKALDPATWPEGIMFREFEDFGAQRSQLPSKVPRFLTPSNRDVLTPDTPVMNLT